MYVYVFLTTAITVFVPAISAEGLLDGATAVIESTRAEISMDERQQREALGQLFKINKRIREIAKRQERITETLLAREVDVRLLAQDVQELEERKQQLAELLAKRLRQLYQTQKEVDLAWLFSLRTPQEIDRHQRFLKLMVDSDHKQLQMYLASLRELQKKRADLRVAVTKLVRTKRVGLAQESELTQKMREKSQHLQTVRAARDQKLSELKHLRSRRPELDNATALAFFERKGSLRAPVEAPLRREYGVYVDPKFKYRLTHKGLFYAATTEPVHAVSRGKVVFAGQLPGYGRTLILDHGDNYHSVYGYLAKSHVRVGTIVQEGTPVGQAGARSPLFGPGLYFEIRHFTDAIDPQPWFKESSIKTADLRKADSL